MKSTNQTPTKLSTKVIITVLSFVFHSNRTNATVHVNLVLVCLCSAIYDVCLSLPLPIRSNCVFLQRALFTSLRQNLSTSIIAQFTLRRKKQHSHS